MPAKVLYGAQWGDEGKGNIMTAEAEEADVIVRLNGAANAGNTGYHNGEKYVLHMLPHGIFVPDTLNIISPYVNLDLDALIPELDLADRFGSNVALDPRTPIVLPISKLIDVAREKSLGKEKVGTTGRGSGPATEDFVARRSVMLGNFLDGRDAIYKKLSRGRYYEERVATLKFHDPSRETQTIDECVEWCMQFHDRVLPLIRDTGALVRSEYARKKRVVGFVAHGIMLDVLNGAEPYTTSSMCSPAIFTHLYGIRPERIVAVVKAYPTRVGEGPFPTELNEIESEELRQSGGEFGATTARPRRCGHPDITALTYACSQGCATEIAVTKLDILTGRKIKLGYAYTYEGRTVGHYDSLTTDVLSHAKVHYSELQGWDEDLTEIRSSKDLPKGVHEYLNIIKGATYLPITRISVGPHPEQVLKYD